jgi:hypothetical protein
MGEVETSPEYLRTESFRTDARAGAITMVLITMDVADRRFMYTSADTGVSQDVS